MFERMEWADAYKLWQRGGLHFPETLSSPLSGETVYVEYKNEGYFYGYDWLEKDIAEGRKQLIKEDPVSFILFTKATNKGTIQTAQMLIEAQSDEERAAIWIAANAKELYEHASVNSIRHYADQLYIAACDFLRPKYFLWHHAMKKLIPEIMIPWTVLDSIVCENADTVMGLIQTNIVLIKNNYSILKYTSLKDGELPNYDRTRVRREE